MYTVHVLHSHQTLLLKAALKESTKMVKASFKPKEQADLMPSRSMQSVLLPATMKELVNYYSTVPNSLFLHQWPIYMYMYPFFCCTEQCKK